MKAMLVILMLCAVVEVKADESKPRLTTPAAMKAAYLAQLSPGTVSSLDRDVARKREVLAKKTERINAGKLDPLFELQAHEYNARAWRAAGDEVKAREAESAANSIRGFAASAANREAVASNSDVIKAKGTSQAGSR